MEGKNISVEMEGNDINNESLHLSEKIKQLECENQKMQEGFNNQRAKLKDLFVQKERELDEMRTKLVTAEMQYQEEIASLQHALQEKMNEAGAYKSELENLRLETSSLWQINRELQQQGVAQQSTNAPSEPTQEFSSLGPQVLSQVKRTLVRKLGGDTNNSTSSTFSPDSKDDSRSKQECKYAQEGSEVLGSIVLQLQEETNALKEKLRKADEKLQASPNPSQVAKHSTISTIASNTQTDTILCSNCSNLESQMKNIAVKSSDNQNTINKLEKIVVELKSDLKKEAALRHDLENQWQEKREIYKTEIHTLREEITASEQQLLNLQQKFLETKDEILHKLLSVSGERENLNKHLATLQADNDFLSGRYLATAEEIENQYINLPNTVDELQEVILKQQQELIKARLGCDFEKRRYISSLDEIQILRIQLDSATTEVRNVGKKHEKKLKQLEESIIQHLKNSQNLESEKNALQRKEIELNRQISNFRTDVLELQEKIEQLTKANSLANTKVKALQNCLETSEQVQKEYVVLSQKLQVALEQLRQAESEVRWQDDDDVSNCPNCNLQFTVTIRKVHCRHCGRIYCDNCLEKTIESGPRKRLARVCDICHTLLLPNTAPYFSEMSSTPSTNVVTNNS